MLTTYPRQRQRERLSMARSALDNIAAAGPAGDGPASDLEVSLSFWETISLAALAAIFGFIFLRT